MAVLVMDTIGRLCVTSKGHHYALTAIFLHTPFIFMIPLKEKNTTAHSPCSSNIQHHPLLNHPPTGTHLHSSPSTHQLWWGAKTSYW